MNLFYDKPAENWNEALPIGNGNLGAMIYGRAKKEIIQLNEISLWSGYKQDADNPLCCEHLAEIREQLFAGNYEKAQNLSEKYMICTGNGSYAGGTLPDPNYDSPFGYYQTAGELHLDFELDDFSNYSRNLNIETGIITTNIGSQTRTYFSSFKENVTVSKISGISNFSAKFIRENVEINCENDSIMVKGVMNNGLGISYATHIKFVTDSGEISTKNNEIHIKNGENVCIFITTATTYENNNIPSDICINRINSAILSGFDKLLSENSTYIKSVMNRVELKIEGKDYSNFSIIKRLELIREGKNDVNLAILLFQFGRYLLLCSSKDILPANLQGLWCNDMRPAWNCDYHININLQMNYWLADVTNLSEQYPPYFKLLRSLVTSGEKTAKIQYGCSGWVAHTIVNPWGFTSPGEGFSWGSFSCAGAWCCTHIWEHFLYTNDIEFLKGNYHVIKGSAEFFADFLVKDPATGYLVTAPSNSPELSYLDPATKKTVAICAGPTMDNSILYSLFTMVKQCSDTLNIDKAFANKMIKLRDKLPPIKIGKYGRIMEWQQDFEETDIGHRHMSPLYGLYPANLITKSKTPELFDAARTFIDRRLEHGGGGTGWSKAWLINFFARLYDGDSALLMLNALLGASTQNNMLNTHPPFQIDGNFGSSAGIAEMLIQSHEGYVHLLPALPKAWSNGEFKGLCARGGFVIDIKWTNSKIVKCSVFSRFENVLKIKINNEMRTFNMVKNQAITII